MEPSKRTGTMLPVSDVCTECTTCHCGCGETLPPLDECVGQVQADPSGEKRGTWILATSILGNQEKRPWNMEQMDLVVMSGKRVQQSWDIVAVDDFKEMNDKTHPRAAGLDVVDMELPATGAPQPSCLLKPRTKSHLELII